MQQKQLSNLSMLIWFFSYDIAPKQRSMLMVFMTSKKNLIIQPFDLPISVTVCQAMLYLAFLTLNQQN